MTTSPISLAAAPEAGRNSPAIQDAIDTIQKKLDEHHEVVVSKLDSTRMEIVEKVVAVQEKVVAGIDQKNGKRRTGRPKNTEKDSAAKVIAALTTHHGYKGGSVTNYDPAMNRQLADDFDLANNALSRFLADKFGRDGYRKYVAACNRNANIHIGMYLALWQGDVTEGLAALLPNDGANKGPEPKN